MTNRLCRAGGTRVKGRFTMPGVMAAFDVIDLGLAPYAAAWTRQKREHARVSLGGRPVVLLVEHPAVLTLGRKAREGGNILAPRALLAASGIEVFEVERGGDVTYHGPGQLVAYAIFPVGRRVRDFLRLLEQVFVNVVESYGLPARANPGYAGVYVAPREIGGRMTDQKIASIGVAVQKDVALHGAALNVNTDLGHFDLILPCGLQNTQMTSLASELGRDLDMAEVRARTAQAFETVFASYDWTLPVLQKPALQKPALQKEVSA